MKKKFEGSARVKRSHLQALRREFETLEMKAGEEVSKYFSRVLFVANKMRTYGEQMQDVTVVEKILRSLSEKFNYVVCSIKESKDIDQLFIDELQSSLIVHEQKFQRHKGEEQALKVTSKDRFGARGRDQGAYRGRGRGRGCQSYDKATVECYKCHKLGHFQYECPSRDKEANYAELGEEEEEMLLMSYVEMKSARREDVWFLDSGCSNHMCGDKSLFCDLNEDFRQKVKLGNNTRMAILGKGNHWSTTRKRIDNSHSIWKAQDLSSRERAHNIDRDDNKSDVCVASKFTISKASLSLHFHAGFGTLMALSLWTFELQRIEDTPVQEDGAWAKIFEHTKKKVCMSS
ncbi:unnamed protein product [Prunus armeniaca]